MYRRLIAFREKHKHCNVTQRYRSDAALGVWVRSPRLSAVFASAASYAVAAAAAESWAAEAAEPYAAAAAESWAAAEPYAAAAESYGVSGAHTETGQTRQVSRNPNPTPNGISQLNH